MKGLIEHIISEGDLVLRELTRDLKGVQAPYRIDEYRDWLQQNNFKGTVRSYPSYLRNMDKLVTSLDGYDDDFYTLVQECFEQQDFKALPALLDAYEKEMNGWLEWAKTANDPESRPAHFKDLLSAFRNYRRFLEEKAAQAKAGTAATSGCMTAGQKLFMQEEFTDWLQYTGEKQRNSAESIVSRINSLNRHFLCTLIPGKEIDMLALLPKFIAQDREKALQLLEKLESHTNNAANHPETTAIHPVTLRHMRRAFSLYVQFIEEATRECSLPCREADGENNTETAGLPLAEAATTGYEYDQLEKRFYNRLATQDRISHSKTVFYPIRFIKALFERHDKLAGMGLISSGGGNLRWLNRWIDDCIARITVLTEKGDFILADIDWLEIDPQTKKATVLLPDGQKALLLTETHRGGDRPMRASAIDHITIDHTPNIAHVLDDNPNICPLWRN